MTSRNSAPTKAITLNLGTIAILLLSIFIFEEATFWVVRLGCSKTCLADAVKFLPKGGDIMLLTYCNYFQCSLGISNNYQLKSS
jgi:hypothetical protein